MKLLILIFILINNLFVCDSYDYLTNSKIKYNISQMEIDFWFDEPITGYHNAYPPSGINCITGKDNDSIAYLISSQSLTSYKSLSKLLAS